VGDELDLRLILSETVWSSGDLESVTEKKECVVIVSAVSAADRQEKENECTAFAGSFPGLPVCVYQESVSR